MALFLLLAGVWPNSGLLAADRPPQTPTELTNKQAPSASRGDVFGARSWAPAASQARRAAEPIALAAPPKLPFTYGGSGMVNGKAVLFLEQENRSLLVHVGDVVDGTYSVESVAHNGAVLRYLPLDAPQVLAFESGGVAQPALSASRKPDQSRLFVDLPDEAPLGQEVPVALGIPPGSPAAKATIELTYDAEALSVLGAKLLRPGRALMEVTAQDPTPSKQLRFKAIGTETVLTEIGIEVTAVDAQGKSVAVRVPAQHIISLVAAN